MQWVKEVRSEELPPQDPHCLQIQLFSFLDLVLMFDWMVTSALFKVLEFDWIIASK